MMDRSLIINLGRVEMGCQGEDVIPSEACERWAAEITECGYEEHDIENEDKI